MRDLATFLCLLVTILILYQKHLYPATRIVFSVIVLFLLQHWIGDVDQRLTKPLSLLQPGSFISYSYRRLMDQDFNLVIHPYRFFINRFAHVALVVSHNDQPHVLEWRLTQYPSFSSHLLANAQIGYIYLVPAVEYLDFFQQQSVVFCVYNPPQRFDITYQPQLVKQIVQQNPILMCSMFATKYFEQSSATNLRVPALYTPEKCQTALRNAKWKEEYCYYDKQHDYTVANGSLSRRLSNRSQQVL